VVRIGVRASVVFRAERGEVNRVSVLRVPGAPHSVAIRDRGNMLRSGEGCRMSSRAVICPLRGEMLVHLGDRPDSFGADAAPASSLTVSGGPGADRLRANQGDRVIDDALYGGRGADLILGSGGGDYIFGEQGADRLAGGDGSDVIDGGSDGDELFGGRGGDKLLPGSGDDRANGGSGRDWLVEIGEGGGDDLIDGGAGPRDVAVYICRRCSVSLDHRPDAGGAPGGDDLRVEDLSTPGSYFDETAEAPVVFRPGRDVLVGDAGPNILESGLGPDFLLGQAGKDIMDAGAGPDRVDSADGGFDRVSCGSGSDTVYADRADLLADCENVTGPAAAGRVR